MYLSNALVLNSGPLSQFELAPSFDKQGLPKPIVLLGSNGSGKTNFLSITSDALLEIAAQYYGDALPSQAGGGHKYFRILGGRSQKSGASFELSLLHFTHNTSNYYYRAKAGTVSPSSLDPLLNKYEPIKTWAETGNEKIVVGPTDQINSIFESSVCLFFPSSRYELPAWANIGILDRDPDADFSPRFLNHLSKPIVVQSSIQKLKPWIYDVLFDFLVDPIQILKASEINQLKLQTIPHVQASAPALNGLNRLISTILRRPDARFGRMNRSHREKRISIMEGHEIILSSLDTLSAGQASLFSIFGTLLQYGDSIRQSPATMQGIVLVDEIDAHLHADLQHDVLPQLIKLFPKIQFIVSAHSPLFPLGMQKTFTEDAMTLLEMPSGITVDAERFSEFKSSFDYFKATQSFDNDVRSKIQIGSKPIIISEGETDPLYLKTAAKLLGLQKLSDEVEFDWIGEPSVKGADSGGKSHLNDALKFLKYNPQFQTRPIVLLYDSDTKKPEESFGKVHIRALPHIADGKRKSGIENLLPESVLEARFFDQRIMGKGDDKGPVPVLNKKALGEYLCNEKRDAKDFENFKTPLLELEKLLFPPKVGSEDSGAH